MLRRSALIAVAVAAVGPTPGSAALADDTPAPTTTETATMTSLDYTTAVQTLTGVDTDLSAYKGRVLLVVNTASRCGYTPQYEGLQALHSAHEAEGLTVLGFPCNQFGAQEPGSAEDIASFCKMNYGVSFPMHAKIDVNGANAHPLYQQLKRAAPQEDGSQDIRWNFTKFLVGRDGTILKRYPSSVAPSQIEADIVAQLAKKPST